MWKMAAMIWRIGEVLDFDRQLAWIRDAGFDGVAFHASAGVPGQWRGVDPSACDAQGRERLRRQMEPFLFSEIHAPLDIELRTENLSSSLARLRPSLNLAADVGATVVTIHARIPVAEDVAGIAEWPEFMQHLDDEANRAGTLAVLEITDGFDAVKRWGLTCVRVNLDVGHMYLPAHRPTLARLGGIGNLIRRAGGALAHLHVHDVDGDVDHVEIGTGQVAFDKVIAALADIDYRRGMTLEMNPDRVTPDGIRRSAQYLTALTAP